MPPEEKGAPKLDLEFKPEKTEQVVDTETMIRAPRVYAQHVQSTVTMEEAILTFSLKHELTEAGTEEKKEYIFPQVVCILSVPHFLRLADVFQRQSITLKNSMSEMIKAREAKDVVDDGSTEPNKAKE